MASSLQNSSSILKAAMYVAFAQELRRTDVGTDSTSPDFTRLVKGAIDDYGIQPGAISSAFGVTRATVSRWRGGDATPGVYMRREVIRWLADRIEEAANRDGSLDRGRVLRLVQEAQVL